MADRKEIHEFAVTWQEKFINEDSSFWELSSAIFSDACLAFGFADAGRIVVAQGQPLAAVDREALRKSLAAVTDVTLIGTAIYSLWSAWARDEKTLMARQNREWLALALERLAALTTEPVYRFQGRLSRMRLVSNTMSYGPMPEPFEEIEQHVTVNAKGRVWLTGYAFGNGRELNQKVRRQNYTIENEALQILFETLMDHFSQADPSQTDTVLDVGTWVLELTNTAGETYIFQGPLCVDQAENQRNLSNLLREALHDNTLFAFDGECEADEIERITLEYNRHSKIDVSHQIADELGDYVYWDYAERLIIDREKEKIEHVRQIARNCKVTSTYEIEGGVPALLDSFDASYLFAHTQGNPSDVVPMPYEQKEYSITIVYKRRSPVVHKGSFDKLGLPQDFPDFASVLLDFLQFYSRQEMLSPWTYNRPRRRQCEYIYCSVVFNENGPSYYYLTDDDTIDIGEEVVVPTGQDNHEAVVTVVDIEYFRKDNAPYPFQNTKWILRRCLDDDPVLHPDT